MKTSPASAPALAAHSQHTPGPWFTDSDGDGKPFGIFTSTHDADGPDDDMCEVYGGNDDDDTTREANARLVASAPDLLAACEADAHWIENLLCDINAGRPLRAHSISEGITSRLASLRSALTKAKGTP